MLMSFGLLVGGLRGHPAVTDDVGYCRGALADGIYLRGRCASQIDMPDLPPRPHGLAVAVHLCCRFVSQGHGEGFEEVLVIPTQEILHDKYRRHSIRGA